MDTPNQPKRVIVKCADCLRELQIADSETDAHTGDAKIYVVKCTCQSTDEQGKE